MSARSQAETRGGGGGVPPAAVELWRIALDRGPAERARLTATLSDREASRARSLRLEAHRNRFIVAHGALREILAGRLGRRPSEVALTVDPGGRPRLRREADDIDLRFSLSHSQGLALVAFAVGREVGADVERIDTRTRALRIARRYFAPQEVAALEALPAAERTRGFFRCWTLKEAYLKALGIGLRDSLASFAVSPPGEDPPRLLWSARGDAVGWTLHVVDPAEGYAAAVAVEGDSPAPRLRDWMPGCGREPEGRPGEDDGSGLASGG